VFVGDASPDRLEPGADGVWYPVQRALVGAAGWRLRELRFHIVELGCEWGRGEAHGADGPEQRLGLGVPLLEGDGGDQGTAVELAVVGRDDERCLVVYGSQLGLERFDVERVNEAIQASQAAVATVACAQG
jgi:hypothetical protein